LARLAAAAGANEFVDFNPLSWDRTHVVRVPLPGGPLREAKGRLRVVDRRTGGEAKFQMQGDDALLVLAPEIPALGFVVFAVEPAGASGTPAGAEARAAGEAGGAIENRFYRVKVDPRTGGIASLYDKEIGRELVDPSCPWPLNAYIYEQPEGGRTAVDDMTKRAVFHRWAAETAKVEAGERGPVAASLVVRSAPKMCASLEQRIVLYEDVKRVDLVNVLDKDEPFISLSRSRSRTPKYASRSPAPTRSQAASSSRARPSTGRPPSTGSNSPERTPASSGLRSRRRSSSSATSTRGNGRRRSGRPTPGSSPTP
jgi:hypothetical protein